MKPACNVLIYGGGAVGSILGWRVAQNSHTAVTVVCRSNYDTVRASGYVLKTKTWRSGHFRPREVLRSGSIANLRPGRRFDYIVCANKITGDYTTTLHDLQNLVSPSTTLVTAQNGMDIEKPLQLAFPNNTILSAICNIGCSQVSPGYIEQTAKIKSSAFLIGTYRQPSAIEASQRDAFSAMDSNFQTINCVYQERWRKLVFNSAWNSMTALTGLNTHELLDRPGAAELVYHIADETHHIATASGISLDSDLPHKTVELARTSLPITPSTLQDVRNKRPLELGPIFGYLITQAAKVGIEVPYLTRVYDLLQQRNSACLAQRASSSSMYDLPAWTGNASVLDHLSQEIEIPAGMIAGAA